jgi:hypothetical protein
LQQRSIKLTTAANLFFGLDFGLVHVMKLSFLIRKPHPKMCIKHDIKCSRIGLCYGKYQNVIRITELMTQYHQTKNLDMLARL